MKHRIVRVGKNRVLLVECRGCTESGAPETSPQCLRHVTALLRENPEVSCVALRSTYLREYEGEGLEALKELAQLSQREERLKLYAFGAEDCNRCEFSRRNKLMRAFSVLCEQPLSGLRKLEHFRSELRSKLRRGAKRCVACRRRFLSDVVEPLLLAFRSCRLISLLDQGKSLAEILHPLLRPPFIPTRFRMDVPANARMVDSYDVGETKVRIYFDEQRLQHLYLVVPPEYSLPVEHVDLLARAMNRLLENPPDVETDLELNRTRVKARIEKILLDFGTSNGGTCSEEEIGLLANYLSRFTAGLGIVEVLMSDPRVQDIYVDSPCGETPVYINHRDFQECETNIYMTEEELEALVSKLRLVSGRPFSEANPVLDAETGGTRITVVGPPLSMDGIALAIRRHKPTPWTLPQLVRNRFLSPLAAGLLSLLVDGRTTILITGSRGAGKTSLLGALMTEVLPRYRIITIEDTPELPVKHLKRAGFKIESLYSRSVVSGSGLELGTDDALRTALRLGDSVLVVGEVRGPEARILYEAMRVGAAGNTVMGTIHGSSARDVFERVVFDLGVPPVSFKSTDVILTVAPLQLRGALTRSRRLVQVVEVRKTWRERTDPALHKLMEHETSSDRLKNLGLRDSEVLKQIARRWGVGEREVLQNVELRAKVCSELVRTSVKRDNSRILELEFVVRSNLAWRSLLYSRELRMISYQRVFSKWKRWLSDAVADLEASDG